MIIKITSYINADLLLHQCSDKFARSYTIFYILHRVISSFIFYVICWEREVFFFFRFSISSFHASSAIWTATKIVAEFTYTRPAGLKRALFREFRNIRFRANITRTWFQLVSLREERKGSKVRRYDVARAIRYCYSVCTVFSLRGYRGNVNKEKNAFGVSAASRSSDSPRHERRKSWRRYVLAAESATCKYSARFPEYRGSAGYYTRAGGRDAFHVGNLSAESCRVRRRRRDIVATRVSEPVEVHGAW